jgi:tRNA(Arg) A34 adenosine deaminase TadA
MSFRTQDAGAEVVSPDDRTPMMLAIEASRVAFEAGDMPYGAVLVSAAGETLHVARNCQISRSDVTAHAELELVREASLRFGPTALRGSTVYASGEPCAMCSGALFWAGVRRIVFGVSVPDMAQLMGGDSLPIRCAEVLAAATLAVQVDGPCMTELALAVLRDAAAAAKERS